MSKGIFQIMLVLIFGLIYSLFIKHNQFKRLEKRFVTETGRSRRIGNILVLAYSIFTVLLIFLMSFYEKR
jgi:ABC-type Fe3+ transport system permease subunit